ncbi:putative RNA-directed DNA polymerase [Rosa chinensis]|uniref:Putative RNA-directed DNA polymerase n=1 Tax=Rosa chinensis TaxID=74649 RepID=A0A2P6R255_ROSCH|nr:putative RNA-directed DNA polymerase [Rosa chinensis]
MLLHIQLLIQFKLVMDKVLGRILYQGLSKQGMYPIPFDLPLKFGSTSTSTIPSSFSKTAYVGKTIKNLLWHQRLGHPTNEVVKSMLKKCKIFGDPTVDSTSCEACLLGKFHKLPFPVSQTRSEVPFDIVHSDVWGLALHLSLDGFKYFVIFIDDCTWYT